MHESQLHRPSRMDRGAHRGQSRPFETVDGVAIGDMSAARERSTLTSSNPAAIGKGQLHAIELPEPFP